MKPTWHPYTPAAIVSAMTFAGLMGVSAYFSNWLILFGALLLGFYVFAFKKLHFILTLATFWFASTQMNGAGTFSLIRWFVLGFSAIAGVFLWLSTAVKLRFGSLHFICTLSVLMIFVSTANSVNPLMTFYKATGFAFVILYGAIAARLAALNEIRFTRYLLTACIFTVFFVGGCRWLLDYDVFFNPNNLGASMAVLAWPVLLWGALSNRFRWFGALCSVSAAMCFVLIVASRSRASLLAAVVSAMAILLALRKLKTAAAIVTAQAVILVALFFYFPDYFKFLTVEVAHKGDATSRVLGSRDWVWEDTLNAIKESPWLGSGFGVSKGISEYWAGGFDSGDSFREQGNSYLGIVEYLGFVGTVPLALTLLCIGRGIFRCCFIRKFKSSGLAVVLAGILSASLVNVGFEAWLFAPGFYLAVVFWSSAFILDDLMESSTERSALNVLKETPTRAFGAFVAGKTV